VVRGRRLVSADRGGRGGRFPRQPRGGAHLSRCDRRGKFDRSLIEAYVDTAPRLVEMLHVRTDVRLIAYPGMGDWIPDAPGAKDDRRALTPAEYDGKRPGADFERLRPPLQVFNAPGGFMVDLVDIPHLGAISKSLKSRLYVARRYLRFLRDRACFGRGTRLTMGNALAAGLMKSALDVGGHPDRRPWPLQIRPVPPLLGTKHLATPPRPACGAGYRSGSCRRSLLVR